MAKHRRPELMRAELIRFYAVRERGGVSFGFEIEPGTFLALEKVGGQRVVGLCKSLVLELEGVFKPSSGLAGADPDQAERGGSAPPGV